MRRSTRLLVLVAVALAGAGIAFAGALPQGFASVSDVAADPGRFSGHEVHVKAIVAEGSIQRDAGEGLARFAITDLDRELPVEYRGSLPELFMGGKTVVVSGTLEMRMEGPVLVAHSLQGGCASKYEPAPGAAEQGAEGAYA